MKIQVFLKKILTLQYLSGSKYNARGGDAPLEKITKGGYVPARKRGERGEKEMAMAVAEKWMLELVDNPFLEFAEDLLEAAVPSPDVQPCAVFNEDDKGPQAPEEARGASNTWSFISNVIFYAALAAIVAGALIFGGKANGGTQLFGFRYFEVLTTSMQNVIPQGSLVVTQKVASDKIQVGDVITFLRSDEESVTHEVIGIVPNFNGSGSPGFETKGSDNPDPDPDIVAAANVLGVVKAHVDGLGFAMRYIVDNIKYVFLGFILILLLSIALRVLLGEKKRNEQGFNNPKRVAAI